MFKKLDRVDSREKCPEFFGKQFSPKLLAERIVAVNRAPLFWSGLLKDAETERVNQWNSRDKERAERTSGKETRREGERLVAICFFAWRSAAIWLGINGNPRIDNERRDWDTLQYKEEATRRFLTDFNPLSFYTLHRIRYQFRSVSFSSSVGAGSLLFRLKLG